jgi:hypothetical protein
MLTLSEEHVLCSSVETAMKLYTIGALGLLLAAPALFAQEPQTAQEAKKDMAGQKQDPLAVQGSGGEEWSKIKGNEKGYVTIADAQPNSWLALNFKNCDKDQDTKVTEAEYTKCQNPQR